MTRLISLAVAAVLLAACSSVSTSGNGSLVQAAHLARESGSVSVQLRSVSGDGETERARGRIDFASGLAYLKDVTWESELIVDGDRVLFAFPSDLPQSATQWLEMELWDLVAFSETPESAVFIDPANVFATLEAAASVTYHGQQELNFEPMSHYSFEVLAEDLAAISTLSGGFRPRELPAVIHAEAWLDADGYMRLWTATFEGTGRYATTYEFEVRFSSYGSSRPVELPDQSLIMTWEDWLDSDDWLDDWDDDWGLGDLYEGADCWGENIADCLVINPELDALAYDASLCLGEESRVCLVPFGNVRTDLIEAIVDFHRETGGIEVLVLPSIAMDPAWIDPEYSQVTELALFTALEDLYGIDHGTPSTFIGLTPVDIVPADGRYGWMFGARSGGRHGVFSYWRMAFVEPYDGSPLTEELLFLRTSKYMGRYVALLHLDLPPGEDIRYLNYADMWGFSDLDSIGTLWPTKELFPWPCQVGVPVICIAPDGEHQAHVPFARDLEAAASRLERELGIIVEILWPAGFYYPTWDSWSEEYAFDLRGTARPLIRDPLVTIIGVTDDRFDQDPAVGRHVDAAWPEENLAVLSTFEAGRPGTAEHEERVYLLLLRAVARAHFGIELDNDPASLMYSGITVPADLDSLALPALP